MKEAQIPKYCREDNPERKESAFLLNEPVLRDMVGLVKLIPKEKACSREKRQLLILLLSEIRRVSFYQRVMEIKGKLREERIALIR